MLAGIGLVSATFLVACDDGNARVQATLGGANAVTPPTSTTQKRASVAKIVFVDKEHACNCTRTRVDGAWKVLQNALGKPGKVPVERLQIDTQGEKVAAYRRQRPMMALPAIYFIDEQGKVVDLLQGEVTKDQVFAALGKDDTSKVLR